MNPRSYNVPHPEWRPHQLEAVQWCLGTRGVGILSAPVGSGKSALAKATSSRHRTIVLTRTKALQEAYGSLYDAVVLKGKGNYRCVNSDNPPSAKCDECLFDNPYDCECWSECKYLSKKAEALAAPFAASNYAYWMTAKTFRENAPSYLFLDEAHTVSEQVLDWCGCTVTATEVTKWNLLELPTITGSGGSILLNKPKPQPSALAWLESAQHALNLASKSLSGDRLKQCERKLRKLQVTSSLLQSNPDGWYIRSDAERFKAKPFSARQHAWRYLTARNMVLMSATVGEPGVMAEELGIRDFQFREVPNQFEPEARPVIALDVPPMGSGSVGKNPQYLDYQADAIAKCIEENAPDELVLIHCLSRAKAEALGKRLGKRGLGDRVWLPPRLGTDAQVEKWNKDRRRKPLVAMTYSWGEGLDLGMVRLNLIANMPYGFLGDSYVAERMQKYPKLYQLHAAQKTEQACGRNRRGIPEHYFLNGNRGNFVVLADDNWRRLKSYYSQSFVESIREA